MWDTPSAIIRYASISNLHKERVGPINTIHKLELWKAWAHAVDQSLWVLVLIQQHPGPLPCAVANDLTRGRHGCEAVWSVVASDPGEVEPVFRKGMGRTRHALVAGCCIALLALPGLGRVPVADVAMHKQVEVARRVKVQERVFTVAWTV